LSQYKPKLVCFSCKFGWGYLTSEETISSQVENWIPIICTGKIDVTHILEAFKRGADGVLILGCPEGDCHYQDGNYEAKKRVYLVRRLLDSIGISKDRVKIELSIDPDGKRIPYLVQEMNKELARLGPLKPAATADKPAKEVTKTRGRR
jgi:F420-non-reducing hydrogenase iron-sulfur subunit